MSGIAHRPSVSKPPPVPANKIQITNDHHNQISNKELPLVLSGYQEKSYNPSQLQKYLTNSEKGHMQNY